jgi:hypothetical protein
VTQEYALLYRLTQNSLQDEKRLGMDEDEKEKADQDLLFQTPVGTLLYITIVYMMFN